MKKITSKLGLLALAGTLAFTSCTKKELVQTETINSTDNNNNSNLTAVYDRTVNYSVLVTAQGESAFRSAEGVSEATVAVAVDGAVVTVTTGADGIATFSGIKPGAVTVSVTKAGWATVNYVVDLNDGLNSDDIDNHSERSAATMVTMMPTSGLGTSTFTGKLEIENNQNGNTDSETMPTGLATLTARVNFQDFDSNGNNNQYAHSGYGQVTNFYVEGLRGITNAAIDGDSYSITLPATAYGLPVEVFANPFRATNTDGTGTAETVTFNSDFAFNGSTTPVLLWNGNSHTGMTYVVDLFYNEQ
ncbi:MAG: hypothetical protein MK212_15990 [Saprospiraceae bacterium]|nr:hypothetical protein [Saprospiraceae bacterium]